MLDTISQVRMSAKELEQEFSVIAHNLANVSTVGYKRRCNEFAKILQEQYDSENTSEQTHAKLSLDFSQGDIAQTGRTLDFALEGKGFFVIETPGGPLYTRNGMFRINPNHQIVDSSGRIVAGTAGPIVIPADVGHSQINVTSDGTVNAAGAGVGKFRIVDFEEEQNMLLPVGGNCFSAPDGTKPGEANGVVIRQGHQESSNVKMIEELVDMIMVSRLYESNIKFSDARKAASNSIIAAAKG